MTKHLNIRVHGQVQGVFFRVKAKEEADDLGVKGFARNESDGTVYIEAEGFEELVQKFTDWLRIGPPQARVESVQIEEGHWLGFKNFFSK